MAKLFRNFRNKSHSILMLHKIDKDVSDWSHDCTDPKNGNDFFMSLVKWPKMAVKKANIFINFRNKIRSILMLHRKKKLLLNWYFSTKTLLKRFEGFWTLIIDFENQILPLFDVYFRSHEKINTIFVIVQS